MDSNFIPEEFIIGHALKEESITQPWCMGIPRLILAHNPLTAGLCRTAGELVGAKTDSCVWQLHQEREFTSHSGGYINRKKSQFQCPNKIIFWC